VGKEKKRRESVPVVVRAISGDFLIYFYFYFASCRAVLSVFTKVSSYRTAATARCSKPPITLLARLVECSPGGREGGEVR